MSKLKLAWLMPIAAATLVACGGGEGAEDLALSQDVSAPKFVAADEGGVTKRSSAWVTLGEEGLALGKSSQLAEGLSSVVSAKSAGVYHTGAADGVLVHLDALPSGWQADLKTALEAGQVVVIESTGAGDSLLRMQKATSELTGVGVAAAAVMIYQGEAGSDTYAVFPFNADEMGDLAAFMAKVGKRSATAHIAAATAQ
jgi:hypothetical protein